MRRTITFVLIGILFTAYARANPLSPQQVPEPLTPWVNWVLQDEKELSCPFAYNSYGQKRCSWPTQLDLDFTATKGSFAINWSVYQESWVVLPGDPKHWPQNVTINSKTAVVLERNGLPAIKLPAGTYQIKGDFFWIAIPENISIPADTGLVGLRVNGVSISMLNIRGGQLWLTENDIGRKKPENVQNSLDIQVFRKIIDEVPMQVTTRLVLEVSGEQREIKLPKPLLDTLVPLSLQSPLPARIEPDGQLLMQVRPGRWQMDIEARSAKETNVLALNTNDPSWPRSEIWVFDARPDLRVVEVEKLQPIDASQTNTPEEWRHLPTYSINQGGNMSLKLIRKGDPEPEPNQLTINRKLWLDFAGEGYTINDTINGKMTKGWRLDALPETQLGKVNLDGVSQLITLQPGSGKQGIEVRKGAISLDADSRIVGNIRSISAVGWEQNFNQVNAELNLPPGWRLLAASGVDNVPDSWVSRWTLLDLFLVLIAALATSRLFNRVWGFFALLTLVLIWHEPGSPHFIWLCILAATALIKVLPQGKFFMLINWVRNAFWLGLIFIVVPFMVNQIRTGLYPQLEYPWQGFMMPNSPVSTINEVATPAMAPEMDMVAPAPMQEQPAKSIMPEKKRGYKSGSSSQSEYDRGVVNFNRYDPDAKVQTGPGLPQWQWHKVNLSWNGSVAPGQQVKLWYLSPTLTMLLGFLRVALVSVLTLLTFGLVDKLKFKAKTVTPALLWFLLIPMWAAPTQNTYADFPSKEVLDELRTRLLEAPDCMPICAQIPQMQVDASDKDLLVTLHVHTQGSVNLPLPVSYDQWFPSQVTVDGKATQGLYREGNGLWLNLPQGEHQVTLRGTTPLLTTFTLPLPLKPNRVVINPAKNSGWQVSGVQDNGEVENQLQFNRTNQTVGNTKSTIAPGLLPPFVRLERTLQLGLDWRLVTQIVRLSPADSAIVLEVPLLAGEQVTTSGIHVKDGKVAVNMATQQTTLQWEAKLEKGEKINFNAADTNYWTEVWKIDVNPIWHIETSGITPIHVNTEGQWLPEWHPWPGETLALQITRPKTVAGQTLTIDSSQLAIRPGKRSLDADLKMSIRSSQGTQHTFTLPEGAVLQTVIIAGQTLPLRQEGRKLTLPINPGKQDVALTWQEHAEISSITKTPQIDLGQASVNTRLNIGLGQDRWVLFVWGPKLSPAVLFWGVLVVIVILAIGLGKVSLTPLKSWHWLLLLIGLSQAPMESAALVVAWLMLLGWRASRPDNNFKYFNLVQIIMGLFTIFSLGILLFAVEQGLLGGSPDMQITGNQSSAFNLNWYQDRSASTLPQATVVSIPLMAYRLLMLAWSFWLAGALLNWLKWGWQCFSKHGLWNKKPERVKTPVTVDKVVEKK